MPESEWTIY